MNLPPSWQQRFSNFPYGGDKSPIMNPRRIALHSPFLLPTWRSDICHSESFVTENARARSKIWIAVQFSVLLPAVLRRKGCTQNEIVTFRIFSILNFVGYSLWSYRTQQGWYLNCCQLLNWSILLLSVLWNLPCDVDSPDQMLLYTILLRLAQVMNMKQLVVGSFPNIPSLTLT